MPMNRMLSVAALLIWSGIAVAEPIVIAHRGASGYLPEHTLEAYAMAYAQGAHYIEPDLVLTKDDVFVCLHDRQLDDTTNVEEAFPERKREDGHWYAVDFTLAEIKSLRVHERLPKRFPVGASEFIVPTFVEMAELVQGLNASTGNDVGIYPELKSPTWHEKEGHPMETLFLAEAKRLGYEGTDAKIFVQCFEATPLQKMRQELGSKLPQIMLLGGGPAKTMLSASGLDRIKAFANGIGPSKNLIEDDPAIVERAHARGLQVHPYTLRADAVPKAYGSFAEEVRQFYVTYGVDGMFTDFPDQTLDALSE